MQVGKDGRVRPVTMHQRRINATQWMPPPPSVERSATTITTPAPATIIATSAPRITKAVTETTFPVNSDLINYKLAIGNSAPMIPPHFILEDPLSTSHAGTATNTTGTSDAVSTDTVIAYISGREQIQTLVGVFLFSWFQSETKNSDKFI